MKRRFFFLLAFFSVFLICSMSFIPSAQSSMVKDDIEEKILKNLSEFDIDNKIFDNLNLNINVLFNFIKILFFFEFGFDLFFLIYSSINDPYMFFAYFFQYIIIGLIIFPNTIISCFDSLLRGDIEDFISIMKLYVMGIIILFFIESNPKAVTYLIGLATYGFILYFSLMSKFDIIPLRLY